MRKEIQLSSAYILLDRSGSMANNWVEAVGSVNAYVAGLPKDTKVYLSVFDSMGYDVVRDCYAAHWSPFQSYEYPPRGGTPLFLSYLTLSAAAEKNGDPKTVLVVMTDGQDTTMGNGLYQAKSKIEQHKVRDWAVVFLGANFDAVGNVAMGMGHSDRQTYSMDVGSMKTGMSDLAVRSSGYFSGSLNSVEATTYTDEDKKNLNGRY